MKEVGRYGLSVPEDSDPPDGPSQLESLAEEVTERLNYAGAQAGKSIIATEQSRESASYGLMGTPDRVQGIILPTDGIICILYEALVKSSVAGAGRVAAFLGSNQIRNVVGGLDETTPEGTAEVLVGYVNEFGGEPFPAPELGTIAGFGSLNTTGQLLPAVGRIFAAAGTYDLSIQFRATSGKITARNRKLWVWTREFPS